jgi:hypothetical protein
MFHTTKYFLQNSLWKFITCTSPQIRNTHLVTKCKCISYKELLQCTLTWPHYHFNKDAISLPTLYQLHGQSTQKEMKLKDAIVITTYSAMLNFKDIDQMQTSEIMLFQICITKINIFLIFGRIYRKTGKVIITHKLTVINFLLFCSMKNCGWNKECEVYKQHKYRK